MSRYQFFSTQSIDSVQFQFEFQQVILWLLRILKFIRRDEKPRIVNPILKEKNKIRGLTLPDFKTDYKASVIRQRGIGKRIDKSTYGTKYRTQK